MQGTGDDTFRAHQGKLQVKKDRGGRRHGSFHPDANLTKAGLRNRILKPRETLESGLSPGVCSRSNKMLALFCVGTLRFLTTHILSGKLPW